MENKGQTRKCESLKYNCGVPVSSSKYNLNHIEYTSHSNHHTIFHSILITLSILNLSEVTLHRPASASDPLGTIWPVRSFYCLFIPRWVVPVPAVADIWCCWHKQFIETLYWAFFHWLVITMSNIFLLFIPPCWSGWMPNDLFFLARFVFHCPRNYWQYLLH